MVRRLLALLDRICDRFLTTPVPGRWDDQALHQAITRHPAGKGIRPGDPPPAA